MRKYHQNLSPPQVAFLRALDQPRRWQSSGRPTILLGGVIHAVWSVPVSLERRGLVRVREDGRYERTSHA